MIDVVWAVLEAALPFLRGGYRGRRRLGLQQMRDDLHKRLPWQRARRRVAAWRRAWARPSRHASSAGASMWARRKPVDDAAWAWWQQRRELYKSALQAAGAW